MDLNTCILTLFISLTFLFSGGLGFPTRDSLFPTGTTKRNRMLCPPGMSPEQCFYSHLAMFVRMELDDPVESRNIGKRSSPDIYPEDMDIINYMRELGIPEYDSRNDLQMFENDRNNVDDRPQSLIAAKRSLERYYRMQRKRESENLDDLLNDYGNDDFVLDKRGALKCPPGMSMLECYDNALAYYIRVMRAIADH